MISPLQLRHRGRLLAQLIDRPRLAIIGAYHFSNLGDMALGESVLSALPHAGGRLQTIYNLKRWPYAPRAIVGGGAIFTKDTIAQLMQRYGETPEALAIVGVDIEDHGPLFKHKDWFSRLGWFSTRNCKHAEQCNDILGFEKVQVHPDLVFGMLPEESSPQKIDRKPVLGLNLPPIRHFPDQQAALLRALIEKVAREAKKRGLKLRFFPFTTEDQKDAALILKPFDCEFTPYHTNPLLRLSEISSCSAFFAARYHSLIFSLITRTPVFPFLYAPKSYRMMADLMPDLKMPAGLHLTDTEGDKSPDILDTSQMIVVKEERLANWRDSALTAIHSSFRAISAS